MENLCLTRKDARFSRGSNHNMVTDVFVVVFPGWRKTDQHTACEQKLIDALVSLGRKNEI